jgi:Protein of unknown function (DUF1064)
MPSDWPPRIKLAMAEGTSKYGARKTTYDGTEFASKLEANVARALDFLMRADGASGRVLGYETQQEYVLLEKSVYGRKIAYVADFVVDFEGPQLPVRVILETKGFKTPVYRIKRRLFLERYGPDLLFEITKPEQVVALAQEISKGCPISDQKKAPRKRKKKTSP